MQPAEFARRLERSVGHGCLVWLPARSAHHLIVELAHLVSFYLPDGEGEVLDAVLAAIADPTRRAMIQRLAHGPATTGQLAALFPISRPAVSQHLRLLREAGLVRAGSDRRGAPNELVAEHLVLVERWAHDQVQRLHRMSEGEPT